MIVFSKMTVSPVLPAKIGLKSLTFAEFVLTVTVTFLKFANALVPTEVTNLGILMVLIPILPSKAEAPILVTPAGIVKLLNPVFWKALFPIVVILPGMLMLIKPVRF